MGHGVRFRGIQGDGSIESFVTMCYSKYEVRIIARQARLKSSSDLYHILFRGINRQIIFEDDEDKLIFLECLKQYKDLCGYAIHGYCLMDNHVHLLIREGKENISTTMKRIGVRYVSWYNRKYNRCGHLFQDRFKSEAVEDDEYLLVVLRYIHHNPLKAGKVQNIAEYRYSSYSEYIDTSRIIDSSFILEMFSTNKEQAQEDFKKFMNEKTADDDSLEYQVPIKLTDEEVRILIQEYANVKTPGDLQRMEQTERNELLNRIKTIKGVSSRQLARLTGISQSVIVRA